MFLVVGLGNPGEEYAKTRHNIGFMAADEIFSRYNFAPFKSKFEGLITEGTISGEKVLLLKPQTYMNLSGNSVGKVAKFYKISINSLGERVKLCIPSLVTATISSILQPYLPKR